jgi:hypothetical protein
MKLSIEQKVANKAQRDAIKAANKMQSIIDAKKNQKPVKSIKINIEWSKQFHPTCEAWVSFQDGTGEVFKARAGGWGYCKESTVIAEIFNNCLAYKLYELEDELIECGEAKPYGISLGNNYPYFAGGVGTSCYYGITEFLGGKFEKVASGKSFDVFKVTF